MRSSILFLALLLLSGCDIVNDPVTGPGGVTPPPEGETKRRVLIEDFTGFRCPNCPSAAVEAENIKDAYDEGNVVLVAVHATSVFAAPVAPIGDGYFDTDFRTDDGDAYLQAFPLTSLPKGMVNRTPYNGTIQMNYTAWSAASASILSQTAKMDLWFSDLTYDGSNTVAGEVKIAVLEALGDTTYNMVVYLTEDHIFDDQEDNTQNPPIIEDTYEHKHVLRDAINSTWGEEVLTGSNLPGDTLTVPIPSYTLDNGWVGDNCSLVAYVYNNVTREVMQVTERKFVP